MSAQAARERSPLEPTPPATTPGGRGAGSPVLPPSLLFVFVYAALLRF